MISGQPLKKKTSDQVVDADDLQMDEDEDDNEEDDQEVDHRNRAKTRQLLKMTGLCMTVILGPIILVVCMHYSQTHLFIFHVCSFQKVFLGNNNVCDVENHELPRLVYLLVRLGFDHHKKAGAMNSYESWGFYQLCLTF
ncbi:hypothetical protein IGI04_002457 [Brassica rapa subsp. trilocularis]|uniref:Uncharacterized protein n=1 Tax=Brassica rapa subsp. trilocularis TaxID=1813537 RepID=A0ABQ7NVM1_BRACM|nr:hypothetical protein IGI04_002457 [Brassica rapa subsp. trilocularis]